MTIRIAEDGEVLAKAKTLFKGYWQNPQANADSWTGDWYPPVTSASSTQTGT